MNQEMFISNVFHSNSCYLTILYGHKCMYCVMLCVLYFVRLSCMSSSSFDVLLSCILPLLLVFFVSIFIFNSRIIKVGILTN